VCFYEKKTKMFPKNAVKYVYQKNVSKLKPKIRLFRIRKSKPKKNNIVKDSKKLYSVEKCHIFVAKIKNSLFIKEIYGL